jgi:hypothetical protein
MFLCIVFLRSPAQKNDTQKKKSTALPKVYDLADCVSCVIDTSYAVVFRKRLPDSIARGPAQRLRAGWREAERRLQGPWHVICFSCYGIEMMARRLH